MSATASERDIAATPTRRKSERVSVSTTASWETHIGFINKEGRLRGIRGVCVSFWRDLSREREEGRTSISEEVEGRGFLKMHAISGD